MRPHDAPTRGTGTNRERDRMPTVIGTIVNGIPRLKVRIFEISIPILAPTGKRLATTDRELGCWDAVVDTGATGCVVPRRLVAPPLDVAGGIIAPSSPLSAGRVGGTVQAQQQGLLTYEFAPGIRLNLVTWAVEEPGGDVLLGWPLLRLCNMTWDGPKETFSLSW